MAMKTLREATTEVIRTFGIDILDDPRRCLSSLADCIDGESAEALVLYKHCDDRLLSRYSMAAKSRSAGALESTYKGTVEYLVNDCYVDREAAEKVAGGLALGIADSLGISDAQDLNISLEQMDTLNAKGYELPILASPSYTSIQKGQQNLEHGLSTTIVSLLDEYTFTEDDEYTLTEGDIQYSHSLNSSELHESQSKEREHADNGNDKIGHDKGRLSFLTAVRHLKHRYGLPDYRQAATHLVNAVNYDFREAYAYLGILFIMGRGVNQNTEIGLWLFEKGAIKGDLNAMYHLGKYYIEHQGSVHIAKYWLKRTIILGSDSILAIKSKYILGKALFSNQSRDSKERARGKAYLRSAAQENYQDAIEFCNEAGIMY